MAEAVPPLKDFLGFTLDCGENGQIFCFIVVVATNTIKRHSHIHAFELSENLYIVAFTVRSILFNEKSEFN